MAMAAIAAAGLALSAYGAYQSNEQNNTAKQGIADQEKQQAGADAKLAQTQQQNQAKQTQDAQWMGMKVKANQAAGIATQAPGGLTSQTGSLAGAQAGTTAGKTLLGA